MMGPLLVGLDGSPESAAALRWAAWFAERTGREVHVAHAWQRGRNLEPLAPVASTGSGGAEFEERLVARLTEFATEVLGTSASVAEHVVVPGEVSAALHKAADRHDGTLLVVGAAGAGGALRAVLGSVSRELTVCPSRAVVVVPAALELSERREWAIVVGVDGSTGASRALRWAAAAAGRGGGRVVAVHAVELPLPDLSPSEEAGVVAEMRRRVEEEWCAPLRLAGVPYSTVVEVGLPAVVVQRAANAASPACVALGSRGLGSVSQRLLGSVTHRLLRELDWPTVVVPGPRDCVCWRPDAP